MSSVERPNIILITTDQQRGDCLGIDGHPVLQTPNLDWLAATGARMRRAYSECPSCVPARRALFSGTAPAANGMVGMKRDDQWNPEHLLAGDLTKAGYQTRMVGKSHVSGGGNKNWRYGFEHVEMADQSNSGAYLEWLRLQRHSTSQEPGYAHGVASNAWIGRPHHLPEHLLHSFWCVDRALHFVQHRDTSAPFFLNISFIDPHPPFTPPQMYYDRYINRPLPPPVVGDWARQFDGPQKGLDPNAWDICLSEYDMQCSRAAYYGMINFVDDQIGRLYQTLRSEMKNTVWLFTSDHGEMLGDHNMFRKTFPYEASARVPFIVKAPERFGLKSGLVSNAPVGIQDIMPTLLDFADVQIPDQCTGKSLLPVLRGDVQGIRNVLHGEHAGQYDYAHGNHYLTDGTLKYIWWSQTGREQLFNLEEDPNETTDLARAKDPRLTEWRAKLVTVLEGRPEGFVHDGDLRAGQPHEMFVPGYRPTTWLPFL